MEVTANEVRAISEKYDLSSGARSFFERAVAMKGDVSPAVRDVLAKNVKENEWPVLNLAARDLAELIQKRRA